MFFEKWWDCVEAPKTHIGWWSLYNQRIAKEGKKLVNKTGKKISKKLKEKVSEYKGKRK